MLHASRSTQSSGEPHNLEASSSICVKVVVELQILESGRTRDVHASTLWGVTPLGSSASCSRLRLWKDSLTDVPASVNMGLEVAESLPAGS